MQYVIKAKEDIFWGTIYLQHGTPVYCVASLAREFEKELKMRKIKFTKTLVSTLLWEYKKEGER